MNENISSKRKTLLLIITSYFSFITLTIITGVIGAYLSGFGIDALHNGWQKLIWLSLPLSLPFAPVRILAKSKRPLTCFLPLFFLILLYVVFIIWMQYYFADLQGTPLSLYPYIIIFTVIILGSVHLILSGILTLIYYVVDSDNRIKKFFIRLFSGKIVLFVLLFILLFGARVNALTDSNLSNNHKSISIIVIEPKNFTLAYVAIPPLDTETVAGWSIEQAEYIKSVYPISDDANIYLWPVSLPESKVPPSGSGIQAFAQLFVDIYKTGLLVEHHQPTKVIGVAPYGFLQDRFGLSAHGFGATPFLTGVTELTTDETLTAHELGHLYFLCDEYNQTSWERENLLFSLPPYFFSCPNANNGGNFNTSCLTSPQSGCAAETESIIRTPSERLYNFMGSNINSPVGTSETWVSKETYIHLLNSFDANNDTYLPDVGGVYSSSIATASAVVIVGKIGQHILTSVSAGEFNFLSSASDSDGSGHYSVRLSNSTGIVKQKYFQPVQGIFADNGTFIEFNETPFQVVIPLNSSITKYEILYNGSVIYEYNISPNSPLVQLQSPLGGETYTAPFTITWNATDADGDNLTYSISISNDSGISWWPLDFDINSTNLTVDNADFTYSTKYRIKVTANDGFNTNTSESQVDFTIIPPPRISVESISEIHSKQEQNIFETIILNDGGQNLTEMAWWFDTAEVNISSNSNTSLPINEYLTVIIEYNYSSGNEKNLSFFTYNSTINDTLSTTTFVGDLRVANLTQIFQNGTQRRFSFVLYNIGNSTLTGINWTLNTGETNISATSLATLGPYENTVITVSYNYSDSGQYDLEATTWNSFNSYSESSGIEILDITIDSYSLLHQQDEVAVTEFLMTNNLDTSMPQVQWRLNTSEDTVTATSNLSLANAETAFVIVEKQYSSYGNFTATSNATDGSHSGSRSIQISILELLLSLQRLSSAGTVSVFEFSPENQFSTNKTATWSFDTNDTGVVWGSSNVTLQPDESVTVLFEHNFSVPGTRNVTARANTSAATYNASLTID